jgi:hypothetical protein
MASNKPDRENPIVLADPANEPAPPKLDSAGKLGPTGERKQEEAGLKDKDRIWRDPASAPREQSK